MPSLNRQLIDDNDVVARYLADDLPETERQDFESYFLEHPQILAELNRTAKFKAGLIGLRDSGELARLTERTTTAINRTPYYAVAASVLVLFAAVAFFASYNSRTVAAASVSELTNRFGPQLQIAQSITIERTRSISYDATITMPENAAAIELRIKPDTISQSGMYRFSIGAISSDDAVKPVAIVSSLHTESDGFIRIYLKSELLTPGVYSIWISDSSSTEELRIEESFEIEMVRP